MKVDPLITQEKINHYIAKIPPTPKALKETIAFLDAGELVKAAKVAESDNALRAYLKEIVNKPIYGFRNEVTDISQIFGIFGVSRSQQVVYNYMISLLTPDKWALFKLNKHSFMELQTLLSVGWNTILQHLDINDKAIQSAITLLPASIIVSDALFGEKIEEVTLLRSAHDIDYNTILQRLTGKDLFDIAQDIAQKWEMDANIYNIVQASSGTKEFEDEEVVKLGKWMHLLLFYTLSNPTFINAELNDFINFQVDYVSDIYEEFTQVIGVES